MTPSIFCRACIATATLTMISLPITTAPVPLYASTVLASPFHIPAAPKGQKKPPAELQCEKPPKPMRSIATNSMYVPGDPTHSKRDPKAYAVYQAAIAPVREYAKKATKLANKYVRSGALKSRDAVCAQDWLYGWAQANALTDMQTPQAIFNMGQLLAGFSMAYLEIRENPYLDNEKKQAIERWLATLASKIRDNINKDIAQAKNSTFANHRYWLGFGVGAAGVATNNDAFFQWGIESARVGLREVQPDGSLPREMNRASRARDYHIFAVAPLVMMAELGMANGINLYDETDGALHKLVKRILASDRDTSFYERRTGKKQIPYPDGNDGIPSSRLGWLEPYYARFPSQEALSILKNKRSVSSTALGGNMTLIYTGKDE